MNFEIVLRRLTILTSQIIGYQILDQNLYTCKNINVRKPRIPNRNPYINIQEKYVK